MKRKCLAVITGMVVLSSVLLCGCSKNAPVQAEAQVQTQKTEKEEKKETTTAENKAAEVDEKQTTEPKEEQTAEKMADEEEINVEEKLAGTYRIGECCYSPLMSSWLPVGVQETDMVITPEATTFTAEGLKDVGLENAKYTKITTEIDGQYSMLQKEDLTRNTFLQELPSKVIEAYQVKEANIKIYVTDTEMYLDVRSTIFSIQKVSETD